MVWVNNWVPFNLHGLILIPTWISNYIQYKERDKVTNPFPTSTVQPLKFGSSNFISYFTRPVITDPCWDYQIS